ncbi:MAG TPA: glycosyltransferase [Acidimicrobiales bacterium]|nr:glycosyltransferase [Acidimicrobiales bacterium]
MTTGPERGVPVVVVPCYNEEHRLDPDRFLALARTGRVVLLFVNDGSTDGTAQVLAGLATADGVGVIELAVNVGKAEAVRRGLLRAIDDGASVVGYYDADLSTPPDELLRLVDVVAARPDRAAVLASRVARLGSDIERSAVRHYLGRVFASAASAALGARVYDSQCGAKLFRVTPSLVAAVGEPFRSAWGFDVELLHRLLAGWGGAAPLAPEAFVEVPLGAWSAGQGSRVTVGAAVSAFTSVMSILCRRMLGGRNRT